MRDYSQVFQSALQATHSQQEALSAFAKDVDADPDTAEKLCWLGCAYHLASGGNRAYLEKAIELFERAIQLDPKNLMAYSNLSGAYMDRKDDHGFRRTLLRWTKVDPSRPQTARDMLHEYEKDTAVPENAQQAVAKVSKLREAGKLEEAEEVLRRSKKVFPANAALDVCLADVLTHLGGAWAKLDRREQAFGVFCEAVKLDPKNWYAQHNLCILGQERGDFDISANAGSAALRLNPDLRNNTDFMRRLRESRNWVRSRRRWWEFWKR
jgi:tetratricopeptide (TPR) repeat protein